MINLLPPHVKQNLHFEELHRDAMFLGELVFMTALVFVALLFAEVLFANVKYQALRARIGSLETRSEVRQVQQFQQQLRLLKNDVERLNRIQEQHPRIFLLIQDLVASLPPSIRLSDLDIDVTAKKIIFSGVSPTRAELLQLREMLKKNPAYGDINLPLANLLKETNIPFTFSLALMGKQ